MLAPLLEHKNKWESALHMDGYYVVGVIAIPYLGYGCIVTVISKEEKTYLMSVVDNPHHNCPNFVKMTSMVVGKRGHWMPCKHSYYDFHVFVQSWLCHWQIRSRIHIHLQWGDVSFRARWCIGTSVVPWKWRAWKHSFYKHICLSIGNVVHTIAAINWLFCHNKVHFNVFFFISTKCLSPWTIIHPKICGNRFQFNICGIPKSLFQNFINLVCCITF